MDISPGAVFPNLDNLTIAGLQFPEFSRQYTDWENSGNWSPGIFKLLRLRNTALGLISMALQRENKECVAVSKLSLNYRDKQTGIKSSLDL